MRALRLFYSGLGLFAVSALISVMGSIAAYYGRESRTNDLADYVIALYRLGEPVSAIALGRIFHQTELEHGGTQAPDSGSVDLYDTAYSAGKERVYQEVRRETYDLDLGQTGWMTAAEFRGFFKLLNLTA